MSYTFPLSGMSIDQIISATKMLEAPVITKAGWTILRSKKISGAERKLQVTKLIENKVLQNLVGQDQAEEVRAAWVEAFLSTAYDGVISVLMPVDNPIQDLVNWWINKIIKEINTGLRPRIQYKLMANMILSTRNRSAIEKLLIENAKGECVLSRYLKEIEEEKDPGKWEMAIEKIFNSRCIVAVQKVIGVKILKKYLNGSDFSGTDKVKAKKRAQDVVNTKLFYYPTLQKIANTYLSTGKMPAIPVEAPKSKKLELLEKSLKILHWDKLTNKSFTARAKSSIAMKLIEEGAFAKQIGPEQSEEVRLELIKKMIHLKNFLIGRVLVKLGALEWAIGTIKKSSDEDKKIDNYKRFVGSILATQNSTMIRWLLNTNEVIKKCELEHYLEIAKKEGSYILGGVIQKIISSRCTEAITLLVNSEELLTFYLTRKDLVGERKKQAIEKAVDSIKKSKCNILIKAASKFTGDLKKIAETTITAPEERITLAPPGVSGVKRKATKERGTKAKKARASSVVSTSPFYQQSINDLSIETRSGSKDASSEVLNPELGANSYWPRDMGADESSPFSMMLDSEVTNEASAMFNEASRAKSESLYAGNAGAGEVSSFFSMEERDEYLLMLDPWSLSIGIDNASSFPPSEEMIDSGQVFYGDGEDITIGACFYNKTTSSSMGDESALAFIPDKV